MTIKIAEDFSRYPAGRYRTDGDWSGERFREEWLVPAIKREAKLIVLLDGAEGYGSSFLEEAFGGLVRQGHFTSRELRDKLEVQSKRQAYVTEIWDYINNAKPAAQQR